MNVVIGIGRLFAYRYAAGGDAAGAAVRAAPGQRQAWFGLVCAWLLERSRRTIRLEHGDPHRVRQYPRPSTAGNRRGGQQLKVSAGRGDIGRTHALGGVGEQGVGPAGLGTGARQPLAAERLHADDGADLVAIDVDVADPRALAMKSAVSSMRLWTPSVSP